MSYSPRTILYDSSGNAISSVLDGSVRRLAVDISQGEAIAVEVQEDTWTTDVKAGRGFIITTNIVTVSLSSEADFFLLKNPSGSGKNIRIKELLISIEASTQQGSVIRIYKNPTITADGTALTIGKLKTGQADGVATAYLSPTISTRGTLREVFQIGLNTFLRDYALARYVNENETFLITVQGTKTNVVHALTILYSEVSI
jgi:hypothetical protein